MYRIPKDLDLSPVVGETTTQLRVGRWDLQFTFGPVSFTVETPVSLHHDGKQVARWEPGKWPDSGFLDILSTEVRRCEVASDRMIVIELANGLEIHLVDDSDHHESMQITFEGDSRQVII